MKIWPTVLTAFALTAAIEGLLIANGSDPGQCNQTSHGQQVLVKDQENKELIIFCINDNGVYKWTTIGGKNPVGELFNPGYDCSKILVSNPEAKNGMYYIHLGTKYAKQVWCDMTTDFGGYILIGKANSSVTWTVPSSSKPVEPYGDPHWASNLGDAPVLDFRIQVSLTEDLSKTLAHWSFRLKSERPLKNLMISDHGCSPTTPGIGNIAYVKDLQTEKIVTTNFRCSAFGGYHAVTSSSGWRMMNSCLRKPCRRGFAFLDVDAIKYQTDHSGSFSFSTSRSISGISHNSTAFVGCDKNECCSCFGPMGGTDDYCGTDCKERKGGTIEKNVYIWFWVRSSIPKNIWSKCMDYKVTTKNGGIARYKLLNGDPTPEKGYCGRRNEALINDGIVVVPDSKTAKKVPAVPGLLKYRKDTEELYVRVNKSWNVVAQLEEVIQLQTQLKNEIKQFLENRLIKSRNELLTSFTDPLLESAILSGQTYFGQLLKIWIGGTTAWVRCWPPSTFHSKCDYKKPTVTIVRVGRYIFGGYATEYYGGTGDAYRKAPGSFIFSLRNKENLQPFKAPLRSHRTPYAIRTNINSGPRFGGNGDLGICYHATRWNTRSRTIFGDSYQVPSGVKSPGTILAGTRYFYPSEVEVFYLV